MSQVFNSAFRAINFGASESSTTLRLQVGTKTLPSGKDGLLFAGVRLPIGCPNVESALAALAAYGDKLVRVSLPRQSEGTIELRLSPMLPGRRCACLFAHHSGAGRVTGVSAADYATELSTCGVALDDAKPAKPARARKAPAEPVAMEAAPAADGNGTHAS
jgi:hypothetical protein